MNSEETMVDELPPPDENPEIGPGRLLSRKREALGLSVEDVAEQLHITMHYVRALETNSHDKLPGDVFIRGYIRAYANLLKLDPLVVINVYNEYACQKQTEAIEADCSRARRRKDRNRPWIIVSGIAFVGMAIALWYFSTASSDTPEPAPANNGAATRAPGVTPASPAPDGTFVTIDNVATSLAADLSISSDPAQDDTAGSLPGAPDSGLVDVDTASVAGDSGLALGNGSDAAAQSLSLPDNRGGAPASADGDAGSQVGSDPTASQSAAGAPDAQTPSADAQPSGTPPSSAPASPTPPSASLPAVQSPAPAASALTRVINVNAGGVDLVQITFNGESMVQVDDVNDKQIYRDVRIAGDVLRISGSAPFNIMLGDAASTELTLNGNSIDFTSSIRVDNSARLTIGL